MAIHLILPWDKLQYQPSSLLNKSRSTGSGTKSAYSMYCYENICLDVCISDHHRLIRAMHAGLHRTAPGVTEQLVDCSGGDIKDEDTGFARKADALARVMSKEVRMFSLEGEQTLHRACK